MKRYEVDIRLYADKKKKVLYKFINWHTWAWCLPMAKFIARLEAFEQMKKYQSAKAFKCKVELIEKE